MSASDSRWRRLAGQALPLASEAMVQLRDQWRGHVLTLIGIVWGATAVILLLSLGTGFTRMLDVGTRKTGDRWVAVFPGYTTSESGGQRPGRRIQFEDEDYERLRDGAPSAAAISPENQYFMSLETPRKTRASVVSAGTPDLRRIQNHIIASGRYLDETDETAGRRVAVLGHDLAEILYGSEDPLGQRLQMKGTPFRVVGVLEQKGFQFFTNSDIHDRMAFIPFTAGRRLMDEDNTIQTLYLNPWRIDEEAALQAEIKAILWPRHRVQDGDDEAIQTMSVPAVMTPMRNIFVALKIVLGAIGTITLAMAGVGVANLMLAIVNERRRELAMRRACGARRSDVVFQLLGETTVIVFAGGCIGIVVAFVLMAILQWLPLPPAIPKPAPSASVVLTTFAVLVATGIGSGVLPARVASRIDPAAALRVT
jgi:putative ABC transport system permease protein